MPRGKSTQKDKGSADCWCGEPDTVKFMVQCTNCEKYIHYVCMGMLVNQLADIMDDSTHQYVCKSCVNEVSAADMVELAKLSACGKVFVFRESAPGIPGTPAIPLASGTLPQNTFVDIIAQATKAATLGAIAALEEIFEKKEKKHNLVIVGFHETEATTALQNAVDLAHVQKYCESLKIEPESVRTTFRDGNKNAVGRIIKVCFNPGHGPDRAAFLRGAKYHMDRDPEFKSYQRKPFVRPDLTYRERQVDKQLREDLKTRISLGEKDLIIRKGKILSARPNLLNPEIGKTEPTQSDTRYQCITLSFVELTKHLQ